MRIGSRLATYVAIFIFIATSALLLIVNFQLKKFAVTLAEDDARLFLEEKQATIDYVVEHLRPPLLELIKAKEMPESYFEPSWMSAGYINRHIMKYLAKTEFSDLYYKNAAINARSPENEADPIEAAFLEKARKYTSILRHSDVVEFDGKPFFVYMRTNTSRFQEVCLKCHSTPDKAPADLIKIYGSERSFGKQIGDIVSVLSLRIPLGKVYSNINSLTIKLFVAICGFAVFFFMVQLLITKRIIVAPLNQITNKAIAISQNDSLLGQTVSIKGQGELKELANAFSCMSERLAENKDNLELLVKQRTKQLEDSRKEYQDLFEKMLDAFSLQELIVDDLGNPIDFVFKKVNPAFEKIIGLSADTIVEKSVFDVLPGIEKKWIEIYGEVVLTGVPVQFEQYSTELDKFFIVSAFKAQNNQFACVFKDITARKLVEDALKDSEAFQRALLEAIPVPLFYKDTDGKYLGFNKQFSTFFGVPKEQLVGKITEDINPPPLADIYRKKDLELFKSGGVQKYESQVQTSDGHVRDVVFYKAVFANSNGVIQGLIGTILDITEMKQLEEEREKMIDKLSKALSEVKTLSGLLPICSHCKKIRDDKGYWNQLEKYFYEHSDVKFSHGICQECAKKHYPDMGLYDD